MFLLWIFLFFILLGTLLYHRASLLVATLAFAAFFVLVSIISRTSYLTSIILWTAFGLFAVVFNVKPIRRHFFSKEIFNVFKNSLPKLSSTEREALVAGTVGWEGDLFKGMPNWQKSLDSSWPQLSAEEKNFLEGPVSQLCEMIDNWDITHNRFDLSPQIWDFLKKNGFFGIIIPKEYGGKAFSAYAHSAILTKVAGRSNSVATVIAVPNSLGPAELLLHYGTDEQRQYYLPRLAKGIEIPSFALTGPEAGSDAGAMPDYGVVCKREFDGKETLGILLNWNKRYITLAPVATVLGLAFKLYDPDHLLGGKESLGITCALIPTNQPGITIGRRHYPLNSAFPNGPTQGRDVFIPLDWVIGGKEMIGQGWRMVVECLAAGRAITLPALAVGGAKISAFTSGAYSRIRTQFHSPIGYFGGVEEALTRIAGFTYIMDATRLFTIAALDRGEKPAVAAAISKYHVTELGRKVINLAMDVHGGKGICMGPHNYLAINYQETPISITVEGANILTRSMIIFGQGAVRCHPYLLAELEAANEVDSEKALNNFDKAIFGHIGYLLSNFTRTLVLGLTGGRFVKTPVKAVSRYYQHLTRFSSGFAFAADMALVLMGGSLKRKEKLSGRLGDVLSLLYMGTAVLKQFYEHNCPADELPLVEWCSQYICYELQRRLLGLLQNFPDPLMGTFLKGMIFPWGKIISEPSDKLGQQVARLMLQPDGIRARLAKEAYLVPIPSNPPGYMEEVLKKVIAVEDIEKRIYKASQEKVIKGYSMSAKIKQALNKHIITLEEKHRLEEVIELRKDVLAVDDFASEDLLLKFPSAKEWFTKYDETVHEQFM